jgi:hypothetical protein
MHVGRNLDTSDKLIASQCPTHWVFRRIRSDVYETVVTFKEETDYDS